MSPITWLHVSDLHFREAGLFDSKVVFDSLLDDIAKRREFAPELEIINFVFITGDLAFSGKEVEYVIVQDFIKDLARITGTPKKRIFMVPGNHDVDRSIISDENRAIINKLGSEQAVNNLLGNPIDRAVIMKGLEGYGSFFTNHFDGKILFDQNHYFYVAKRRIGLKKISILGLNSSWASSSDQDQLNLFLGERQVREAIDQMPPADLCFVLLHHPFKWLRDFDSDICEPLLLDKGNIVLHGHLHKTGITLQQTPSASSMIIGAGAGFERRDHLNSYSLGYVDIESESGALYLRTYSDRDGGFWSEDTTSYRNIQGRFNFKIQSKARAEESESTNNIALSVNEVDDTRVEEIKLVGNKIAITDRKSVQIPSHALTTWWQDRGYKSDPFLFDNAKDLLHSNSIEESFQYWYVDPNLSTSNNGFSRPTIDEMISTETSEPVLIFAPSGGGKTFCRILATKQAEESNKDKIVEISNITSKLSNPEQVSALELILCVYRAIGAKYDFKGTIPQSNYVQHVLTACDSQLQKLFPSEYLHRRVFTFIDDLDQLFSEHDGEKNRSTLIAISDLCKAAASQNDTFLALRIFLPLEIKEQLLTLLGVKTRQKIRIVTLKWSADHCESILEARLNSCWKYGPNKYDGRHLDRLFHQDALTELRRQLKDRPLSPRCVIRLLRALSYYAYQKNLSYESAISSNLMVDFLKSNSFTICPLIQYPIADITLPITTERKPKFEKLTNIIKKISTKISNGIESISRLNDLLGAFKILSVTVAAIIFFLWILFQEIWFGRHVDLNAYLKKIWDFIINQIK